MKGNRLIKIIKKYQRIFGKDPEILFKGVFGYSDIEMLPLRALITEGLDARGRAVCVIEGRGQGRTYPTLALDEIERVRATTDISRLIMAQDSHEDAVIRQNTLDSIAAEIPDDLSTYVRERTESIINHRIMHPEYYADPQVYTQGNTQGNSN